MALTIYDQLEQGSAEWLQARAGIVTASTIGQLITARTVKAANNDTSRGLYATLIAERITGRVEPVAQSRAMLRGTLLEDEARRLYSAQTGWPVQQIGFARLEEPYWVLGASPDGLLGDDGGLEIKSPSPKTHVRTVLSGEIPAYNRAQVQACMLVTGRSWWHFVSYLPGEPLFIVRDEPDAAWVAAIEEAVAKFEEHARNTEAEYRNATRGLTPTPYWNPFEEEEEII